LILKEPLDVFILIIFIPANTKSVKQNLIVTPVLWTEQNAEHTPLLSTCSQNGIFNLF